MNGKAVSVGKIAGAASSARVAVEPRSGAAKANALAEAARLSPVREAVKAAAATIAQARMQNAGVQAHTVARSGLEVRAVEHVAVFVDVKRGEVKVDRSEVTALFRKDACAVMRLAADNLIDYEGVNAALRFAWAGDRVMGAQRVRTVDLDRVAGCVIDGLTSAEVDLKARLDWDIARLRLMQAEFRILDGVMRADESAHAAAAAAYPQYADRKKLQGMGDQALIAATETLAFEYGFKACEEAVERPIRLR